jgi:hypothetical protein
LFPLRWKATSTTSCFWKEIISKIAQISLDLMQLVQCHVAWERERESIVYAQFAWCVCSGSISPLFVATSCSNWLRILMEFKAWVLIHDLDALTYYSVSKYVGHKYHVWPNLNFAPWQNVLH